MLSAQLLRILRGYWRLARPHPWLFPGRDPSHPIDQAGRRREALEQAWHRTGGAVRGDQLGAQVRRLPFALLQAMRMTSRGSEWIDYFEKSRDDPDVERPKKDRVETFENLLERAEKSTLQLQNAPLQLTPEQQADILKLNEFRDDLEHVKPRTWFLGVGGLPRMGRQCCEGVRRIAPVVLTSTRTGGDCAG
jgi:hypothetical protein